jgi:hypothetical protein
MNNNLRVVLDMRMSCTEVITDVHNDDGDKYKWHSESFMCSILYVNARFLKKGQQMHLRLFIDHTYMFQSSSATIFRVYRVQ